MTRMAVALAVMTDLIELPLPRPQPGVLLYASTFEALNDDDAVRVMSRIVGWLGWLGDSTLSASKQVAAVGDSIAFTLTARHSGSAPIHTTLTATLPLSVTLVPGSLTPGAAFDLASGRVTWAGLLLPSEAVTVSYQVKLNAALLTRGDTG